MSGWAVVANNTRAMLRFQGEQLARLQEMAASGARVNRPSDAPTDAFKILQYRADAEAMTTYAGNLGDVLDMREVASTAFQEMSDALARVRLLGSQIASGTYSERDRAPVAREIDSLLEQIVSMANLNHHGRYVFGGGRQDTSPYVVRRQNGRIVGVDYVGGRQSLPVPVAAGVEYGTAIVGDEIFRSDGRQVPTFLGSTGAAPGAGTANIRGDAWLTVTHTSTAYQGASGIAAGDTSAADDTIVGTRHTLTIDEPNHTLQLDDGPAVSFTGAETNLRLTNAAGDAVRVNTTGVAAGFQGTVAITADGTLSLDDGATSVPIGFAAADAVTDSRTGRLLYVDTTGLARAGLEPVRTRGTYDLFGALIAMRDAIANTRGLPEKQQLDLLDEAMGSLAEVTAQLTQVTTSNGAQLQAMNSLKTSLENLKSITDQQVASLENADLVDVASELARRQVLYEMCLMSAARLLSLSLLKYIN